MRSRIRNTMMILCFALILSFVSCSNTRVDEKKQIYIGVTCYDQKDTFIGELIESIVGIILLIQLSLQILMATQ